MVFDRELLRFIIARNKELIEKTALRDCHIIGLNSFIINEFPKMRLFIAEPNCELYRDFDPTNPLIPVHRHKYDDYFFPIQDNLRHHFYRKIENATYGSILFNSYTYKRIGATNTNIELNGYVNLIYEGSSTIVKHLKAETLHTVSIDSSQESSWIIIETHNTPDFVPIGYHQDLHKRPELYKPFTNPLSYLWKFLDSL